MSRIVRTTILVSICCLIPSAALAGSDPELAANYACLREAHIALNVSNPDAIIIPDEDHPVFYVFTSSIAASEPLGRPVDPRAANLVFPFKLRLPEGTQYIRLTDRTGGGDFDIGYSPRPVPDLKRKYQPRVPNRDIDPKAKKYLEDFLVQNLEEVRDDYDSALSANLKRTRGEMAEALPMLKAALARAEARLRACAQSPTPSLKRTATELLRGLQEEGARLDQAGSNSAEKPGNPVVQQPDSEPR